MVIVIVIVIVIGIGIVIGIVIVLVVLFVIFRLCEVVFENLKGFRGEGCQFIRQPSCASAARHEMFPLQGPSQVVLEDLDRSDAAQSRW